MQNSAIVIHRSNDRGYADHGWLQTWHTFSFAGYYNPDSMHFGVMRVLNDDIVRGGGGFGLHPHENMEIITVPFRGSLEHADSMSNTHVIRPGDVQVMSAGTGIMHSEYNHDPDVDVNLAQIWLYPREKNVSPRYDQKTFDVAQQHNAWQVLVSPDGVDDSLWIHQQAWIQRTRLDAGASIDYATRHTGNGVYLFVIEGEIRIGDVDLHRRDGAGYVPVSALQLQAKSDADILVFDVPMKP